jgi:hypothetical protein
VVSSYTQQQSTEVKKVAATTLLRIKIDIIKMTQPLFKTSGCVKSFQCAADCAGGFTERL